MCCDGGGSVGPCKSGQPVASNLKSTVKRRGLCWGTWSCDVGAGFGPGSMGVLLNWVQNPSEKRRGVQFM